MMGIDKFSQLSFEQLDQIQQQINTAILKKKTLRIEEAVDRVMTLISVDYPEVSLWSLINELVSRCEADTESEISTNPSATLPVSDYYQHPSECDRTAHHPSILCERLKFIRNEVLRQDDARLLLLTNGGIQKTSNISGKELAEVLQETVKKLERLDSIDLDQEINDLDKEVLKISEWAQFKLGVSIIQGTLTVISPFASKDVPNKSGSQPDIEHSLHPLRNYPYRLKVDFPINQPRHE